MGRLGMDLRGYGWAEPVRLVFTWFLRGFQLVSLGFGGTPIGCTRGGLGWLGLEWGHLGME